MQPQSSEGEGRRDEADASRSRSRGRSMRHDNRHPVLRYGGALLVVALVLVLLQSPILAHGVETRVILLFLAVLLAAWYGGLGSGLFATGLIVTIAVLLSWPSYTLWRVVQLGLFALGGGTISGLVEQ